MTCIHVQYDFNACIEIYWNIPWKWFRHRHLPHPNSININIYAKFQLENPFPISSISIKHIAGRCIRYRFIYVVHTNVTPSMITAHSTSADWMELDSNFKPSCSEDPINIHIYIYIPVKRIIPYANATYQVYLQFNPVSVFAWLYRRENWIMTTN